LLQRALLVAQTSAALIAAALQNITSSFAGHTLEKAVLARTMTLFRLIGTLWHYYSLFIFKYQLVREINNI
jgi:hypothetical protein